MLSTSQVGRGSAATTECGIGQECKRNEIFQAASIDHRAEGPFGVRVSPNREDA